MSDVDVHGPIDFILLEFKDENLDGSVAREVFALVDAGIVALLDVLVIRKDDDGRFSGIALEDVASDHLGGFAAFAGARSGLVGDEDIAEAASAMEPGTVAALLVYENVWARPFVGAVLAAQGDVIASARIPADVIMETLEALEA